MAAPYTPVAVSGYNANPPADDGSAVAANQIKWSTAKTKLGDPLNTALGSVDSHITTAFGKSLSGAGIVTSAIDYPATSADQGKLVVMTGTSTTQTTPDATVVASPFVYAVLNKSTGTVTIDGNGTQTIDGNLTLAVPSGAGVFLFTDGTNWFTSGQNFTGVTATPLPSGFKNLAIKVASNTTVTVSADFVTTTDGTHYQSTAVSSTINLGTSAVVDALATGTIAIDTWYYIWVIAKADGTTKCIASLQSTANATFLTNLAAIASGAYTYYARVGAVQTIHASATLYGTWQLGRRAQYVLGLAQTAAYPIIGSGSNSSTQTQTSVSRLVPPTASVLRYLLYGTSSSTSLAPNASNTFSTAGTAYHYQGLATGGVASSYGDMLLESTNVWYGATAGSAAYAVGWDDNI